MASGYGDNLYWGGESSKRVWAYNMTTKSISVFTVSGLTSGIFGMAVDPSGILYLGDGRKILAYDLIAKTSNVIIPKVSGVGQVAINAKKTGQEALVSINLTLRAKNQYGKDRQFKKKDYHGGNFKIDKTDKYKRDTFSSTVLVRNLAL
jgi:hypothetical protein